MKSLNGVTHAIVKIPKDKKGKTVAIVTLAFGQRSFIKGISYIKNSTDGKPAWFSPMDCIDSICVPVFEGDIFVEICKLCSQAISRVKEQFGRPEWGQTYIVYKDRVEIQPKEKE